MKKNLTQRGKPYLGIAIFSICILASVVALSVINFYCDWGNNPGITIVFNIVTAFTAILGVVGVVVTLKRNRDIEEAQFTLELSNSFVNSKDFYDVYDFWDKYNSETSFKAMIEKDKKILPQIISLTYKYLDFFEPLYILIVDKIIDVSVMSRLFEYRFCLIVNNWAVQRYVLNPKGKEHLKKGHFDNILNLYKLLKIYKTKIVKGIKNANVPYSENDLIDYVKQIQNQTTTEEKYEKICTD